MIRMRYTVIAFIFALGSSIAASRADEQKAPDDSKYDYVTLVFIADNTLTLPDVIGGTDATRGHKFPVPFVPPEPGPQRSVEGVPKFGDFATLDKIADTEAQDHTISAVHELAKTHKNHHPIRLNVVSTAQKKGGHAATFETRPALALGSEGLPKGRALVTAGVHPQEWMSSETVSRKLEVFQGFDFGASYSHLLDKTAPGSRDVFFAEHVMAGFIPLRNPDATKMSLDNSAKCVFITVEGGLNQLGALRAGRFQRKNLNDNDGVPYDGSAADTDDLNGVDLERNLPPGGETGSNAQEPTYAGKGLEAENKAIEKALKELGIKRGDRYTGIAALDVHTPLNSVFFPGGTDAREALAKATATAAYGKTPGPLDVAGSLDHFLSLADEGPAIPAATLELPPEPAVAKSYAAVTSHGVTVNGATGSEGLQVFCNDTTIAGTDKIKGHRTIAFDAIDAALDFAAGPAIVSQVLIVQDKSGTGTYRLSVTPAKAEESPDGIQEVIYWKEWHATAGKDVATSSRGKDGVPTTHLGVTAGRWLDGTASWRILVTFSKPMAKRSDDPGPTKADFLRTVDESVLLDPLTLPGATAKWLSGSLLKLDDAGTKIVQLGCQRYDFDTYEIDVPAPEGVTARDTSPVLSFMRLVAKDLVQQDLDGDPSTVAYVENGVFKNYDLKRDASHRAFNIDSKKPIVRAVD